MGGSADVLAAAGELRKATLVLGVAQHRGAEKSGVDRRLVLSSNKADFEILTRRRRTEFKFGCEHPTGKTSYIHMPSRDLIHASCILHRGRLRYSLSARLLQNNIHFASILEAHLAVPPHNDRFRRMPPRAFARTSWSASAIPYNA